MAQLLRLPEPAGPPPPSLEAKGRWRSSAVFYKKEREKISFSFFIENG